MASTLSFYSKATQVSAKGKPAGKAAATVADKEDPDVRKFLALSRTEQAARLAKETDKKYRLAYTDNSAKYFSEAMDLPYRLQWSFLPGRFELRSCPRHPLGVFSSVLASSLYHAIQNPSECVTFKLAVDGYSILKPQKGSDFPDYEISDKLILKCDEFLVPLPGAIIKSKDLVVQLQPMQGRLVPSGCTYVSAFLPVEFRKPHIDIDCIVTTEGLTDFASTIKITWGDKRYAVSSDNYFVTDRAGLYNASGRKFIWCKGGPTNCDTYFVGMSDIWGKIDCSKPDFEITPYISALTTNGLVYGMAGALPLLDKGKIFVSDKFNFSCFSPVTNKLPEMKMPVSIVPKNEFTETFVDCNKHPKRVNCLTTDSEPSELTSVFPAFFSCKAKHVGPNKQGLKHGNYIDATCIECGAHFFVDSRIKAETLGIVTQKTKVIEAMEDLDINDTPAVKPAPPKAPPEEDMDAEDNATEAIRTLMSSTEAPPVRDVVLSAPPKVLQAPPATPGSTVVRDVPVVPKYEVNCDEVKRFKETYPLSGINVAKCGNRYNLQPAPDPLWVPDYLYDKPMDEWPAIVYGGETLGSWSAFEDHTTFGFSCSSGSYTLKITYAMQNVFTIVECISSDGRKLEYRIGKQENFVFDNKVKLAVPNRVKNMIGVC